MAQTIGYDIDSIGSNGGFSGFGGNNSFLWFLLLLARGGDGGLFGNGNQGAAAAAVAKDSGETQSKLDCLAQQHATMSNQLQQNELTNSIRANGDETRGLIRATNNVLDNVSQSLAECCCDLKTGQQSIKTDIAMQTATLQADGFRNTQNILDKLSSNEAALKDAEIRRLQDALQTQTILGQCGGNNGGIDINVLARAMQSQGQVAA